MFLFQTTNLVAGAQAGVAAKLQAIPADVMQRIASRGLTADDRIFLNAAKSGLYASAGDSAQLLSSLAAICKDKGASLETRQAAAFFYGNSISTLDCQEPKEIGGAVSTVLNTGRLFISLMAEFNDRGLAKMGAYGAEVQFGSLAPLQAEGTKSKGADVNLSLSASVPMSTSYGGTKVYFDYSGPQFVNPPGIRLSASLPTNIDFSNGVPGSTQFRNIYNFYQDHLNTTSYASLAALKAQFAPLVDIWMNALYNSTQSVQQFLATNLQDGHTVGEFIALLKDFRTAEAFNLFRNDAGRDKFYTSFGMNKPGGIVYNNLVTNVVQSEFAKRASGKLSTQTSITVDLSKKFSILGYFDYNSVNVKAVEELPGNRVNFFDAGGMLLFHARNIVLGAGGGYQWGKASMSDAVTIPLNAIYGRVDIDKTFQFRHIIKMALQGTFTETLYEGDKNTFASARVGAKVSKTIPISLKKQENMVIKSMDLDIYANPFVDLNMSKGVLSKDFTLRTGISVRKIPIPQGFMTIGAYSDFKNNVGGGLKNIDVGGGINIAYHF